MNSSKHREEGSGEYVRPERLSKRPCMRVMERNAEREEERGLSRKR
jgi:hypothetical protein